MTLIRQLQIRNRLTQVMTLLTRSHLVHQGTNGEELTRRKSQKATESLIRLSSLLRLEVLVPNQKKFMNVKTKRKSCKQLEEKMLE